MATKLKYNKYLQELETFGNFDSDTVLTSPTKGKIVQSTGDFQGYDFDEGTDILYNQSGITPTTGTFAAPYSRYVQTNILVETRELTSKNGNRFGFVVKRAPNIPNTLTWGGISLYPNATLMRQQDHKFRFSFDYRGYSGGHTMEVFQNYEIGWGTYGVNLPTPWNGNVGSFDTDWEWQHYNYEYTVTSSLLNVVAGAYDWNSTTQYPAGDYGIRYNGNLYRHRTNTALPTLGVDPETEYQQGGVYDAKWTGGAAPGYFNVYRNMKIGFNYNTQNARGTHIHVDNIQLTDITDNISFKYDLSTSTWVADNLLESGIDVFAKGTGLVSQARTDTGTDVFAIEGSRVLTLNGTSVYSSGGRGLRLTVFNSVGTISTDTNYDVYGVATDRDNLATALSNVSSTDFWVLTSYDAIGTAANYNSNPSLRNFLISAGSKMWDPSSGSLYLWYYNAGDVRNPYAAVGKGSTLIKEDGSGASDSNYKRKAVIDIRVS